MARREDSSWPSSDEAGTPHQPGLCICIYYLSLSVPKPRHKSLNQTPAFTAKPSQRKNVLQREENPGRERQLSFPTSRGELLLHPAPGIGTLGRNLGIWGTYPGNISPL